MSFRATHSVPHEHNTYSSAVKYTKDLVMKPHSGQTAAHHCCCFCHTSPFHMMEMVCNLIQAPEGLSVHTVPHSA